jgi:peroxiredoxin Q/BCP
MGLLGLFIRHLCAILRIFTLASRCMSAYLRSNKEEPSTMPLPTLQTTAPGFTLPDETGTLRSLKDYHGTWLLIYFYPKAMTPGCTVQACTIRDNQALLKKLGVAVVGISPDKPTLLKKFIDKEGLNFTLLSDSDNKMADAYGAWQEKSMYGRTYMGMARMSVLVDPAGLVRMVWPKVTPAQQAQDIAAWFKDNV